jgi:hypothetical protein
MAIGLERRVGRGRLLSVKTAMVGGYGVPDYGCDEAGGLGELVHVVGSTPRRKHVVEQVIVVVPHPVVGIEECFHMPPRALDRVRVSEQRRT